MMRYERLIAQRYLRSKRQLRFINIIMLVSIVGITVGVAALIVVLSVFNGFNSVVTKVLVGFDPHVRIEAAKGSGVSVPDSLLDLIRRDQGVAAAEPYVASKALLMTPRSNRVVMVKGVVDSTFHAVSGVDRSTVLGEFRFHDTPEEGGIVLGMALADRLGTMVGSELMIVSPVGVDLIMTQFGEPITRKETVTGIYDSNNKDYDAHYAFISLESARQLFQLRGAYTGIEVRLHRLEEADVVKGRLQSWLGPGYRVSTWYDLHRDLYSVMLIERWTAYIILCLIIGVATFNVLGSLTMGVIEKRRDIGILKALGATRKSITRIFMLEGVLVGVLGTAVGLAVGLLVCWLQIAYGLFALDPTVYIIPAIPVEVRWTDIVAVVAASMTLTTWASFSPARRAARQLPVEAIRWE